MLECGGSEDWSVWMLKGVLTMVIVKSGYLCSISFANETKGMRWPWAMNGSITMCCLFDMVVVVVAAMIVKVKKMNNVKKKSEGSHMQHKDTNRMVWWQLT